MNAEELAQAKKTILDATATIDALAKRLERAKLLLREWRDKYGGKEHHKFSAPGGSLTASPTDLVRDTQRFIEGK